MRILKAAAIGLWVICMAHEVMNYLWAYFHPVKPKVVSIPESEMLPVPSLEVYGDGRFIINGQGSELFDLSEGHKEMEK